MAQRLLVSDGTNAREVLEPTGYSVAALGFVRQVDEAYCVLDGIVRQYWPPAATSSDSDIVWTQQALTVTNYELIANQPSIASITLDPDGTYAYTDDTDENNPGVGGGSWLDVPVTGLGQYLIRADVVSGTPDVGAAPGIWFDAFVVRTFGISLATQGTLQTVLDITVAAGNVTPDAGTEVVRRVTIDTNIVAVTKVAWLQNPWDLEDAQNTIEAKTVIAFYPNGTSLGVEGSGAKFIEDWHVDAEGAGVPDPENFTVQTNLISGDTPTDLTGHALGVPHTLDADTIAWRLSTLGEQDLSCVLDVIIGDGSTFVTKSVTMHSVRTAESSDNIWSNIPLLVQGLSIKPADTVATLIFNPDGTFKATATTLPDIDEDWHSEAPTASDPENYEVFIDLVTTNNVVVTGDLYEQWLNLSATRTFIITLETLEGLSEIGRAHV